MGVQPEDAILRQSQVHLMVHRARNTGRDQAYRSSSMSDGLEDLELSQSQIDHMVKRVKKKGED